MMCHKRPSVVSNLWVTWHEENSSWAYCSEIFPAAWPGPLNVRTAFPLFQDVVLLWPFSNISSASTSLNPCLHQSEILFCPIDSAHFLPGHVLLAEEPWLALYLAPPCTSHIGSILRFLIFRFVCLSHHLALTSKKSLSIACRVSFSRLKRSSPGYCVSLSLSYMECFYTILL